MNPRSLSYVLVTPARNEAAYIELTLKSVVAQSVRPLRWVIVSDGSTDRTDEIAREYAARHDWIEFIRMPERAERNFAGKVSCFNAGYDRVKSLDFDAIGSLDADLSFDEGYFEFLLGKLAADPRLGLTGTPFSEQGRTYDYRFASLEHVSGACQLFRRECYDDIGGYMAVKGGGIDVIAVLAARQKGWRTRTWPEKTCEHHRPMGTGNHSGALAANFSLGQRQYRLGFHPLWQTFRGFYQMTQRPYVIAGSGLMLGYAWAMVRREERPIGQDLIEFQRRDQMRRLRAFLRLDGSRRTPGTT
jgi:biofilm PGA synthesis N-glycosyltransferase PgaC